MRRGDISATRPWPGFLALAAYATLRWGTMLVSGQWAPLWLSFALAGLLAAVVGRPGTGRVRARVGTAATLVALLGLLALCGIPAVWLLGLHVGRVAQRLGDGITGLNGLLVPYHGADPAVGDTVLLGGGGLLLLAGVSFGIVPEHAGRLGRCVVAVPLLVLAVVPSTVVAPRWAALHGLLLFLLLTGFVLMPPGAAVRRRGSAWMLAGAGSVALALSPAFTGVSLWLHLSSGHGTTAPPGAERFDWQQTYGAAGWPQTGETMFTVSAPRPAYWKTEDLDRFDGNYWTTARAGTAPAVATQGIPAATLAAGTETLHIQVENLISYLVVSAGSAGPPVGIDGAIVGVDPGTWASNVLLQAGTRYRIPVYVPLPAPAVLARAGRDYPTALAPLRSVGALGPAYDGVRALARALTGATPYADVVADIAHLHHGYTYTLDPPPGGAAPLAAFLLASHRGYCQQFAGSLALLLRLQGVPARVAVGFSTGTRHGKGELYTVTDEDAHAWVEVYFPGQGWVTFDPTPAGAGTPAERGAPARALAPTLTGPRTTPTGTTTAAHGVTTAAARRHGLGGGPATTTGIRRHTGGAGVPLWPVVLGAGLLLGLAGGLWWRARHRPRPGSLAELEAAFAACGRPLKPGVTLARLARRLEDAPAAAAYVRALAAARYGGVEAPAAIPSARDRRALRRWLARDGGPAGRLRALWALPPTRGGPGTAA